MNEGDLFLLLRARYPADEYALIPRVPDATAGNKGRTADAVAMSLWPSRGLELHGFELKASRADWLVELKNPAKADAIARYCDRWWLVVADESFVKSDELPQAWGLLAPKGGKLVVKQSPAKLTPAAVGPDFLAALLRAAQAASSTKAELEASRLTGYRVGAREATEKADRELRKKADELGALQHIVTEFERTSGVHISHYNAGKIGDAVKVVMSGGLSGIASELTRLEGGAAKIHAGIRSQLEQIGLIASRSKEESTV